jgi:hypothetical protein
VRVDFDERRLGSIERRPGWLRPQDITALLQC